MTTFVELVDRIETAVADAANATWTSAEIATFLNEGIRDYSNHFPLVKQETISCVASQNVYALSVNVIGALRCEYPTGEDPPQYLGLRSNQQADFFGGNWFDVAYDELWIGPEPSSGENIELTYTAVHDLIANVSSISGNSTVPAEHEPLLVKYAIWQCALNLQMAEQQVPTSNSSLLMAQLSSNARRLEASYSNALAQAIWAEAGKSEIVDWSDGRIY